MKTLYRVVAPHFVAGVEAEAGLIIHAAPILRWSIGKSIVALQNYACRKGWAVQPLVSPAPLAAAGAVG